MLAIQKQKDFADQTEELIGKQKVFDDQQEEWTQKQKYVNDQKEELIQKQGVFESHRKESEFVLMEKENIFRIKKEMEEQEIAQKQKDIDDQEEELIKNQRNFYDECENAQIRYLNLVERESNFKIGRQKEELDMKEKHVSLMRVDKERDFDDYKGGKKNTFKKRRNSF